MDFDEWFGNDPRPGSLDPEFDRRIAMAAWNAAINRATLLVEERFDSMEPWLTPEEMAELQAK